MSLKSKGRKGLTRKKGNPRKPPKQKKPDLTRTIPWKSNQPFPAYLSPGNFIPNRKEHPWFWLDCNGHVRGMYHELLAMLLIGRRIFFERIPVISVCNTTNGGNLDMWGIDIIITTLVGNIYLQIKSSNSHKKKFVRQNKSFEGQSIVCAYIDSENTEQKNMNNIIDAVLPAYTKLKKQKKQAKEKSTHPA